MSVDRAAQLVEAGIWLKLSGDREGARKLFERALKLDPGNTKAAQLLAGAPAPGEEPAPPVNVPVAPVVPPVPSAGASNPFERPSDRSATDWGAQASDPSAVSLDSDWGRMTGAATPVPQYPPGVASAPVASSPSNVVLGNTPVPAVPPAMAPPPRVPPRTMQFVNPAPKTTLQLFTAPREEAVDAGPVSPSGMPEAGRAPKKTAMQFAPTEAPLLPIAGEQVAPSGAPEPGARSAKRTMQFVMPPGGLRSQLLEDPAPPSGPVGGERVAKTMQFTVSPSAEAAPSGPANEERASAKTMQFTVSHGAEAAPSGPAGGERVKSTMQFTATPSAEAAPSGPADQGRVSKTMEFAAVRSVETETFDFSPGPLEPVSLAAPGLEAPRAGSKATQQFGGTPAPPTMESETFDFSVQPVAPAQEPAKPAIRSAKTMMFVPSPPLSAPRSAPIQPETFDFGAEPVPLPAATPSGLPEDSRFASGPLQLFGPPQSFDAGPPPSRTIELGGDPGPEVPPPSTPPLFGYGQDASSGLGGHVPTPSPSTPPLFASIPVAAPAPRSPGESAPAWSWSNAQLPAAAPAPAAEFEPTPEPRPSPSLAPRATSAWDQRSNPGIKLEAVVGPDRALDLLSSDSKITRAPASPKEEIATILRGARDLLDLDDHSGAMELILKAQHIAPDDPDVLSMRERSEKTLLAMFESKLGKMETIPRVLLKDDEIIWLNLDHRAGFVLAQIDGTVNFDDLFSVSGMSRIDTARILSQLVEEGVISRG